MTEQQTILANECAQVAMSNLTNKLVDHLGTAEGVAIADTINYICKKFFGTVALTEEGIVAYRESIIDGLNTIEDYSERMCALHYMLRLIELIDGDKFAVKAIESGADLQLISKDIYTALEAR